jgi:hypothetical protein
VSTLSTLSMTATLDDFGSTAGPGQTRFDAYVSYCDSDEEWTLSELLWTSRLERMCSDLITASQEQDDGKLGGICEKLLKVLGSQPSLRQASRDEHRRDESHGHLEVRVIESSRLEQSLLSVRLVEVFEAAA